MQARLSNVDINEVLRYLGCKDGKNLMSIDNDVAECFEMLKSVATPKVTYKTFSIEQFEQVADKFDGNDVKRLLENAHTVVMFGATLGVGVDKQLAKLQIVDMAKAVTFDALASSGIENVCDNFMADVESEFGFVTDRFSPGYGDLPFASQEHFANVLDLQKNAGISLTSSGIMLPQKSVTAIFGIVNEKPQKRFSGCDKCNMYQQCALRKENVGCGQN